MVQIHTGVGCGEYFDVGGAQPLLLESVLDAAALRRTTFVLLHGGSPVERTLASLISKPNVYVDVSALELLWSVSELARVLRPWLETMPEHVLFGTDAGPWGPGHYRVLPGRSGQARPCEAAARHHHQFALGVGPQRQGWGGRRRVLSPFARHAAFYSLRTDAPERRRPVATSS